MLHIESSSNKQFKMLKTLKIRKNRYKNRKYIIEGLRIIEQAIKENEEIDSIYVKNSVFNSDENIQFLENIRTCGIETVIMADKLFEEISDTVTSQGLIAVLNMKTHDLGNILNLEKVRILVLDCVQDPGNLGTMIRTADAANFNCVILSKGTVDPYNEKVIRSTMGSVFQIPIIQSENIVSDINVLLENNFQIIATELNGSEEYDKIEYKDKTAIIIGNEGKGVSKEILDLETQNVIIPMAGKAESLNASIAAAVIMYEVFRQSRNNENRV